MLDTLDCCILIIENCRDLPLVIVFCSDHKSHSGSFTLTGASNLPFSNGIYNMASIHTGSYRLDFSSDFENAETEMLIDQSQ